MGRSIKFIRQDFTDNSTIGEVLIDGIHQCFYLEPTCRQQDGKVLAIPEGTYEIVMYDSPKARKSQAEWPKTFDYKVPLLLKVPGHSYVEIHPGNSPQDTEDCLCPGVEKGLDWVGQSVVAWTKLVTILQKEIEQNSTFIDIIGGVV